MRRLFFAVLAALSYALGSGQLAPARAAEAERLKIDPAQSKLSVQVGRSGFLKFLGHSHNIAVKEFGGSAQLTPGAIEPAALEMTVKADSLAVTDKVSEGERSKIEQTMKNEVLEASKYPNIVFKSTKIAVTKSGNGRYAAHITGDLTLHGVTRPLALDGALEIGEHRLHATGAFSLRQSDFGIKRVKVAGGTVSVKDELKLAFDIVAH